MNGLRVVEDLCWRFQGDVDERRPHARSGEVGDILDTVLVADAAIERDPGVQSDANLRDRRRARQVVV